MRFLKDGRAADAPKRLQIAVCFDEKTLAVLDRFCKRKGNSRAEEAGINAPEQTTGVFFAMPGIIPMLHASHHQEEMNRKTLWAWVGGGLG